MPDRIYNFSAGPATLPYEVLTEAAKDIVNFQDKGIGLIEMSHRSKEFIGVVDECEALLRELLAIPADYKVLFLQGGASTQFAMVPMNLLGPGQSACYLNTATWSGKAIKEAGLFGNLKLKQPLGDWYGGWLIPAYLLAPPGIVLFGVGNVTRCVSYIVKNGICPILFQQLCRVLDYQLRYFF